VCEIIGFEMNMEQELLFHESLGNAQLRAVLDHLGLPISGSKSDRSQRIVDAEIRPSQVLSVFDTNELMLLCRKLPGVKVSGTKSQRTERIIAHFAGLTVRVPEESDDPRAAFYQYFEEFAGRDNQNLYQRKLIRHDRDMEKGFEEGTRFLFEEKLAHALEEMEGVEHCDGTVKFPNGELLMWDNKGKESIYKFPKNHQSQFKRYIRESVPRVSVFLVIAPEVDPQTRLNAMKVRQDTATDTDIALISAADLKFVAENWKKFSNAAQFNLEVFNTTGVLNRQTLEERMTVLS